VAATLRQLAPGHELPHRGGVFVKGDRLDEQQERVVSRVVKAWARTVITTRATPRSSTEGPAPAPTAAAGGSWPGGERPGG
jgi:hypothetical protein